jgi:hypothetical protein
MSTPPGELRVKPEKKQSFNQAVRRIEIMINYWILRDSHVRVLKDGTFSTRDKGGRGYEEALSSLDAVRAFQTAVLRIIKQRYGDGAKGTDGR